MEPTSAALLMLLLSIIISFIKVKVIDAWLETSAWVDLELIKPDTRVWKMFDQFTVRFKAKFSDQAVAGSMFARIEDQNGSIISKPVAKGKEDVAEGTTHLLLPPGKYILTYGVNNLFLISHGIARVGPIDYSEQFEFEVLKPDIRVEYTIEPKEPMVGQQVTISGKVTIEGEPPAKLESFMRDSKVKLVIDTITKEGGLDLNTGEFKMTWMPDKPGDYNLLLEVVPAETYEYIGAFKSINIRVTVSGKITIKPGVVEVLEVSNPEPMEGEDLTLKVKSEPLLKFLVELDGTNITYITTDKDGLAVFTIAGSKIKAGPHVIRISNVALPTMNTEYRFTAKEKPEITIYCTLADRTLPKGGIYDFMVDTYQDGQLIPHKVQWSLSNIASSYVDAPTGLSAVRLHFPTGRYRTRIILPVIVQVWAGGTFKRFSANITLGE
jgi:hypothetical protein